MKQILFNSFDMELFNAMISNAYYENDAEKLRQDGLSKFGDKMLAFRTELEIVDEYTVNFN